MPAAIGMGNLCIHFPLCLIASSADEAWYVNVQQSVNPDLLNCAPGIKFKSFWQSFCG